MELLNANDRTEIAVYNGRNLMLVSTRETRFFEAWKERENAIIPARSVRPLTKAIFSQRFYYRYWTWPQSQGLRGFYDTCRKQPTKDYHFDGLRALADLFANETYDTIQFRPISAFPDAGEYPPNLFSLTGDLPKATSMPGTIHIPKKLLLHSLRRNPPYPPLGYAAAHRRPEFHLLNRSNPTYSS